MAGIVKSKPEMHDTAEAVSARVPPGRGELDARGEALSCRGPRNAARAEASAFELRLNEALEIEPPPGIATRLLALAHGEGTPIGEHPTHQGKHGLTGYASLARLRPAVLLLPLAADERGAGVEISRPDAGVP